MRQRKVFYSNDTNMVYRQSDALNAREREFVKTVQTSVVCVVIPTYNERENAL